MSFLINPYLFAGGGGGFGSPFYLGSYADTGNLSVYTFSSKELGGATADRKIYCSIGTGAATPVFNSVTIGGVASDRLVQQSSTTGIAWFVAEVPTGNTGDIVITLSAAQSRCAISLYATYASTFAPHHTNAGSAAASVTLSDNPVNIDGYAVCSSYDSSTGTNDITWSGVDARTLSYDSDVEATTHLSSASVGPITETINTGDWTCQRNGTLFAASLTIAKLNGTSYYTPVLASNPSDTVDRTTYTFTATGIGTANANRVLIIGVLWSNASVRTLSSFTVDGSSTGAIILGQTNNSAMLAIPWATGTTATIVITMSGGCTAMGIGVYDTRPRSMIYPVKFGSAVVTGTSVTCTDVGVRKGGFLLGAARALVLETQTAVYNGTDTLTIDAQGTVEDFTATYLSATITENAGFNDPGISSATSVTRRMVFASFI